VPESVTISAVSRLPRAVRSDPREVSELRALAEKQPELSAAAALQIELVDALRRVQARVATSLVPLSEAEIGLRLREGRPLLDFDHLTIEWSEARLLFRQITDALRRHDALDAAAAARLMDVGRSAGLPALARRWFERAHNDGQVEMLDEVLAWAMRPFLARAADRLQPPGFAGWLRGVCPICGGEPDFACITTTGERQLICSRCQTRWPTNPFSCPFCNEASRDRITSFATPDGTYRVTACQSCRRYLKTLDGRRIARPPMPSVDAIATLPLDAVVMKRGFTNG
jgi:FdhE protein